MKATFEDFMRGFRGEDVEKTASTTPRKDRSKLVRRTGYVLGAPGAALVAEKGTRASTAGHAMLGHMAGTAGGAAAGGLAGAGIGALVGRKGRRRDAAALGGLGGAYLGATLGSGIGTGKGAERGYRKARRRLEEQEKTASIVDRIHASREVEKVAEERSEFAQHFVALLEASGR